MGFFFSHWRRTLRPSSSSFGLACARCSPQTNLLFSRLWFRHLLVYSTKLFSALVILLPSSLNSFRCFFRNMGLLADRHQLLVQAARPTPTEARVRQHTPGQIRRITLLPFQQSVQLRCRHQSNRAASLIPSPENLSWIWAFDTLRRPLLPQPHRVRPRVPLPKSRYAIKTRIRFMPSLYQRGFCPQMVSNFLRLPMVAAAMVRHLRRSTTGTLRLDLEHAKLNTFCYLIDSKVLRRYLLDLFWRRYNGGRCHPSMTASASRLCLQVSIYRVKFKNISIGFNMYI